MLRVRLQCTRADILSHCLQEQAFAEDALPCKWDPSAQQGAHRWRRGHWWWYRRWRTRLHSSSGCQTLGSCHLQQVFGWQRTAQLAIKSAGQARMHSSRRNYLPAQEHAPPEIALHHRIRTGGGEATGGGDAVCGLVCTAANAVSWTTVCCVRLDRTQHLARMHARPRCMQDSGACQAACHAVQRSADAVSCLAWQGQLLCIDEACRCCKLQASKIQCTDSHRLQPLSCSCAAAAQLDTAGHSEAGTGGGEATGGGSAGGGLTCTASGSLSATHRRAATLLIKSSNACRPVRAAKQARSSTAALLQQMKASHFCSR